MGWAGLAKVAPNPRVESELIAARLDQLDRQLAELDERLPAGRSALAAAAAGLSPASIDVRSLAPEEARLHDLARERMQLADERADLAGRSARPAGRTDPHAHLRQRRVPLEPDRGFRARLLAGWAVISTPVVLLALAVVFAPEVAENIPVGSAITVVALISIEGLVRGQFFAVLVRFATVIVLLVGLHYLIVDWRIVLAALFAIAGLLMLVVNLRDAWRR